MHKNKYNEHILKEVKWNLGLLIWGANYKGHNACLGIETMTCNLNMSRMTPTKYKQRFWSYNPMLPTFQTKT